MNNFTLNSDNTFSFAIYNIFFRDFRFKTVLSGEGLKETDSTWRLVDQRVSHDSLMAVFTHPDTEKIETVFNVEKHHDHVIINRSLRNMTDRDLYLHTWSDMADGHARLGGDVDIYSTENCCQSFLRLLWDEEAGNVIKERPKEFGTFINGTRYNEPIVGRTLSYGRTENQPYPAQVLMDKTNGASIVIGPLTNLAADFASRYASAPIDDNAQLVQIDTERLFRAQDGVLVRAGTTMEGEQIYCGVRWTKNIRHAIEPYNSLLRQKLTLRKNEDRLSVFDKGRVWGSWNLGLYRDISHDLILKQARIISETRPDLNWIQIDDGYTAAGKPGPFILEEPGIDKNKFPNGMKAIADDIKALGLRPAIWMGLIINPEVKIPKFAEDWLLLKKDGSPLMLPAGNKFLDFSLKDVRDYFESVIRTVVVDWGFEGFKFDFWSDHFCCTDALYRNKEFTGTILRDWFWKTLRKYVGDDGFLLTCCCVGSGNPFIGQYADSYRCGIDIGHGQDWYGQASTAFWFAQQAVFNTAQFILPNLDSMGDFTRIVDQSMHRCWTSFCALSGAHVEYGGLLDQESDDFGSKTVEAFNWIPLGQMPKVIDYPVPLQEQKAPMLWQNQSADGKTTFLAVCNWHEEKSSDSFNITAEQLGLETFGEIAISEFWSEVRINIVNDTINVPELPAKDACVYMFRAHSPNI